MTREQAIAVALSASERHDTMEDRLLTLEVYALTTGLKDDEKEERAFLWMAHDLVERETLTAYAQLYLIDPAACEALREGREP
jgi:hypothetical protein